MRRATSMSTNSLNAAGALRLLLSISSATSATSREGRAAVPAKMTSSISPPRICLARFSPITQRSASTRFDLPQPFGPTTPVMPGWISNSVGSTKDLNPDRRSLVNCIPFFLALFPTEPDERRAGAARPRLAGAARQRPQHLVERLEAVAAVVLVAVDVEGWRALDLHLVLALHAVAEHDVLDVAV